ncbi:unnamed protein product [Dovyalis caffra]|uniref:Uncharacterized protein n=1 Tax=Dovyalis caffra TaxID=77055 RepID=A0AAV1R9Y9_9ROSI|nr:unnamed protein product [Dovyalis caffra]
MCVFVVLELKLKQKDSTCYWCILRAEEIKRNMMMESSLGDMLLKVGMFVLVQALVYLILSKSSNIFSKTHEKRSLSFKTARSVSIRRILAALQDLPAGGELSPASSKSTQTQSPTVEKSKDRMTCKAD